MKEVKILSTIKLSCYGEDLRSKKMKNLKMLLDDNKLIYTYNRSTKSFYVVIDSKETAQKANSIYRNFIVEYELIYIDAFIDNNVEVDSYYIKYDSVCTISFYVVDETQILVGGMLKARTEINGQLQGFTGVKVMGNNNILIKLNEVKTPYTIIDIFKRNYIPSITSYKQSLNELIAELETVKKK